MLLEYEYHDDGLSSKRLANMEISCKCPRMEQRANAMHFGGSVSVCVGLLSPRKMTLPNTYQQQFMSISNFSMRTRSSSGVAPAKSCSSEAKVSARNSHIVLRQRRNHSAGQTGQPNSRKGANSQIQTSERMGSGWAAFENFNTKFCFTAWCSGTALVMKVEGGRQRARASTNAQVSLAVTQCL